MNRPGGPARPFRPGLLPYLLVLFALILFGDWFVALPPGGPLGRNTRSLAFLVRLADTPIHALVALAVTAPLLAALPGRSRWAGGLFVFALALGLDADHFVAARSLSLIRIMYLPRRPPTHSLTFAVAVGALSGLLGLAAGNYRRRGARPGSRSRPGALSLACENPGAIPGATTWAITFAWLAFAALASHVLRDAPTARTPILWPLDYWSIPPALYYLGEAGLCLVGYALARSGFPRLSPRKHAA